MAARSEGGGGAVASSPPPSPPEVLSSLFYGSLPPRGLYVRWCAANALLPAVQFSIAPWQYDDETSRACRAMLSLRSRRRPLLEALARRAASTGEPIVRPLWWYDPHDPTCLWVDDQFMLGNATLVAPVLDAEATSRAVYLPRGDWTDATRKRRYAGGRWIEYAVAIDELAVFDRTK